MDISTKENPDDLEKIFREKFGDYVMKCKICGCQGGSSMNVPHYYNCKYSPVKTKKQDTVMYIPDNLKNLIVYPKSNSIFPVMQRELAESTDKYSIIGTFGAGPCIIVAMRDPKNKKTMLAHIDSLTKNPLRDFFVSFEESKKVHVYLCGGDNSNKEQASTIIKELYERYIREEKKYIVVYCHLIDHTTNNFGINSDTGEIYPNNISQVHFNKEAYESHLINRNPQVYEMSLMFESSLRNITLY